MEVRENLYQRMEVTVGPERAVECEDEFEQVLEAKVAEMVRETKVKCLVCRQWLGQAPHQEERHNVLVRTAMVPKRVG